MVNSVGGVWVTFPIAFPASAMSVQYIGQAVRSGSTEAGDTQPGANATGFWCANGYGTTQAICWFAIGY